jgi:SAM-dependent methyltransferase
VQPAPDSLERLVPDALDARDTTGRATLELHLARYAFAASHLRSGRALDIACGVGYGTRLLAERGGGGQCVVGVDVSAAAVAHAREHYGGAGVEYRVCDALAFEDPEGFDTIVSLETVEHVADPELLIARLVGLLRPGGVLIASVPTTPSVDLNPHHRHDFTERSFRRLVGGHGLTEQDCLRQVQPVSLTSVLRRSETRMGDLRAGLPRYYASHPRALLRRIGATLRHGFSNRYLTVAWRSPTEVGT